MQKWLNQFSHKMHSYISLMKNCKIIKMTSFISSLNKEPCGVVFDFMDNFTVT